MPKPLSGSDMYWTTQGSAEVVDDTFQAIAVVPDEVVPLQMFVMWTTDLEVTISCQLLRMSPQNDA